LRDAWRPLADPAVLIPSPLLHPAIIARSSVIADGARLAQRRSGLANRL